MPVWPNVLNGVWIAGLNADTPRRLVMKAPARAPNKTAAQVGEKAGWLRAMGSSRRSA